jgi:hypothetical protein
VWRAYSYQRQGNDVGKEIVPERKTGQNRRMSYRLPFRLVLGLLVSLVFAGAAQAAETYKVGDTLAAFEVKDAKEVGYTYEPGKLSYLIVSYEMSPGKAVNKYLSAKPADYLEKHQAAFMANIYGMPGIGRFFALPKMAKYDHRILLADSETLLTRHPAKDGLVTVFSFDSKGVITSIRELDPAKELDGLFAQP